MLHSAHRRRRLLNRLKTAVGVTLAVIVCGLAVVFALGKAGVIDLPSVEAADQDGPTYAPRPDDPFEGTPAADWKEFDAIVWPEAEATDHFTRKEVERALKEVEDVLWAGRVDWANGKKDRGEFLELFAPFGRDWVAEVLDGPDRMSLVSELAGLATLAAQPRVTGTITVGETKLEDTPVLQVTTNLVWGYGLNGELLYYGDHLLVVNVQQKWDFVYPEARGRQLWPGEVTQMATMGVACLGLEKGLLVLETAPEQSSDTPDPNGDRIWQAGSDTSVFTDRCK